MHFKPDAGKAGHGTADSARFIQYAAPGGCDFHENEQPPFFEYLHEPSE